MKNISKIKLPKMIRKQSRENINGFPLSHYSYSSFVKFSTNQYMFKLNYINGQRLNSTRNISGVIGNAFHQAMDTYYSSGEGTDKLLKNALHDGMAYLTEYSDGFIEYSSRVPNKQKAQEIFAFCLTEYVKAKGDEDETILTCEEKLEAKPIVEYNGEEIKFPVKLVGYIDKIVRDSKGRIKIIDYKTADRFSDPEKIDGQKMLQAVQYYFLVLAEYGEKPHSMVFEEIKKSKNRDGSPQLKEYEMVFAENPLFFDFYFRFYDDVTQAILGKQVYVPNIYSFFDNEVAMVSYIHRLDVDEELATAMKEEQTKNITDLLKKKIANAGSMKKYLKTLSTKFVSAKNLNYKNMKIHERILQKLATFGMAVEYEDKIIGSAITLYRYTPAIGLKMKVLAGYVADIEQAVGISGIRILAPIPGTMMVGFEIPNEAREFVDSIPESKGLELAIGQTISGEDYYFDLREAPHMLVAGASGSGKSVFLNVLLHQLSKLDNVELHLFDPKRVELIQFKGSAVEYENDTEKISDSLEELVMEMEIRYEYMEENGIRKMDGKMPYKVIVIDEFGDLTISNEEKIEHIQTGKIFSKGPRKGQAETKKKVTNLSNEIMKNITLLAQKARAAGMHIVIATQRPSVDIITGTIKNNFPTKVAFRMAKAIDSQVVLGENGAEKLLGKGDMIFSSDEGNARLQGYNY